MKSDVGGPDGEPAALAIKAPERLVSRAKLRQRRKRRGLLIAAVVIASTLALGWWPVSLLLLLLGYIANEVLLADHVFYDPGADYSYSLGGVVITPQWHKQTLRIAPQADTPTTVLLKVSVTTSIVGRLLDPWVEVTDGVCCRRQYFERGAGGCRYVNLTAFRAALAAGKALTVRPIHCAIDSSQADILAFFDEDFSAKRLLIIAPHADDAEIAAFGLYSQSADCTIVTVTAGETDAEQFMSWLSPEETALQAARFKGEVRCLNAVAAAIWGGLPQERCIALGYACMQLEMMRDQPEVGLPSPYSGLNDTRLYRQTNRFVLPSDDNGQASWCNLLADLSSIIAKHRPQVIVSAHPLLDKHPDHVNATRALWQVLQEQGLAPQWLLYANHLDASQDYPFGPAHSELGLPPRIDDCLMVDSVYSVTLDSETQRRKALALDLMHDLKRPLRAKKWLRKRLQQLLVRRPVTPYGEDDFFRKAVRSSEVFLVANADSMQAMMRQLDS